MKIKVTYQTTIPTCTILEGYKEIEDSVIFEISHGKDVNEEANRYLSQYFTRDNFKITKLEVLTRD